jgi:hypothetical protein
MHIYFPACFPCFEETMKIGSWVFVYVSPNFLMPELIFTKLGVYIMPPEAISAAYFTNPFHQ